MEDMTGWRNIGRKLRVALVGPDRERQWLAERLSGEVEIYDGVAAGIHNLAPATVDAVIVIESDRIGIDAADVARRIRKNFVGTVLVVRAARAKILEEQLGLILGDELEAAKLDDTVSVAAQTTWALANLSQHLVPMEGSAPPEGSVPTEPVPTAKVRPVRRPSARKPPPLDEVPTEETTREVLSEAVLAAVDVTGFDDDKTPVLFESATRPFTPSSDMLAAVAKDDAVDASAETLRAKRSPVKSIAASRRGSDVMASGSDAPAEAGGGHPSWKKPPQRRPSASVLFTGSIMLPADEGAQPISIVDPERPSTPPRPTPAERSIAPDERLYPSEAPPKPAVRPVSMLPAVKPTSSRRTLWLTFAGLVALAVWLLIEVLS